MKKYVLYLLSFILIISCSQDKDLETAKIEVNDKKIFNEGIKFSKQKKYREAIENFKKINDEFPFSEFSASAIIYNAYLNFELNNLDETVLLLTDYINMNPTGKFSDYAHYMLGMCYYVQISEPDRDSEFTKRAIEKFNVLIKNFPQSDFSMDAKFKIQFLSNYIAKKEFNIAMFYLKKNAPTPAIKRFSTILKNHKKSSIIPQTLYRISEAFLMLGLTNESEKSLALLKYNFPDNIWTKQVIDEENKLAIEENKEGFFSRLFK